MKSGIKSAKHRQWRRRGAKIMASISGGGRHQQWHGAARRIMALAQQVRAGALKRAAWLRAARRLHISAWRKNIKRQWRNVAKNSSGIKRK